MDETDKKRKIIYENNQYVKEYSDILQILDSSQCKYTKNSNGVFLNLTTTDKDIIDKIYPFFVNNTLDTGLYEKTDQIQSKVVTEETKGVQKKIITKEEPFEMFNYSISEFTPEEREIIQISQNYQI